MNNRLLQQAYVKVSEAFPTARPACFVILGSGLSDVAEIVRPEATLAYRDIPCLGGDGVAGHADRLVWGECAGLEMLVFCGRRHWYEGRGWEPVAAPVYISKRMGAHVAVVTNAAGGIRDDLTAGALMMITDHVHMIWSSPLLGDADPLWGPRFADQSAVYDPELGGMLLTAAARVGENLRTGVYLATSGPTYETPAEVRAFKALGADAVGMSTTPEAMLANAAGMKTVGLSCIANRAAGCAEGILTHDEVLSAMKATVPRMRRLLRTFFEEVAARSKQDRGQ